MTSYLLLLILTLASFYFCECSPFPSPPPPDPTPPGPRPPGADGKKALPTQPTSELTYTQEWSNWKVENERGYVNDKEELFRRDVWLANKMFIEQHNLKKAQESGYHLAMNQFGDLTYSEWKNYYLSQYKHDNFTTSANVVKRLTTKGGPNPFPEALDWRNKNAVSPVKNQDKCGSSYAFSAIGALEGAASLAKDKLIILSEQNIIDCSVPYGNHGCNSGTVQKAYQYVISVGGVDTADSYPYSNKQETCHYRKEASGIAMSGIVSLPPGSEKELLAAVATVGPVSVSVDGSSNAFRFYAGGVFNTINCSTTTLNHAMVVTGYGVAKTGQKYWLVKNSWGPSWGDGGYILMVKDNFNQCGIATDAAYPTL